MGLDGLLTAALSPTITTLIIATLIVLLVPIVQHIFFFGKASSTNLPAFLLAGPSGSGKTTLLTYLERGNVAKTHTSQLPLNVELELPASTNARSDQYRSVNDTNLEAKKIVLVDTPGHGKLRQHALDQTLRPKNLRGIIFVVDSSSLSNSDENGANLTETAQYLHDLLLSLQKRHMASKAVKPTPPVPVLIAANKSDLFTALPADMVQSALEGEIEKLRQSKSKGLVDSGVSLDDGTGDDSEQQLGGGGEDMFAFGSMKEYAIDIEVAGGCAMGSVSQDGIDIKPWLEWIGQQL